MAPRWLSMRCLPMNFLSEPTSDFMYNKLFPRGEHTQSLQASMNTTLDEITQPRHKHTMVKAAIQEAEWKQANLTRRVLKLVSAQEIERKRGIPLDQTEEQIRMRLEDLYMQLMQPTQYRSISPVCSLAGLPE
ncbi:putative nucleoporin Nup54 [Chionoecetes opilio]|uniref:Putative nucleoporin Nup54 n=1 Tax=Chionoecetes opilio TaxID=41210 RepID=A0A8J4YI42_CHIOP|nr:putative nucleoporin Nup54 [Chionoecetes opilio]